MQYNYKQEYVADVLGSTQPEYSKLETGHRKIDSKTIKELCKLYDVGVDVLLKQNPSPHQLATELEMRLPGNTIIAHDTLTKILDNYNTILENFTRQQQAQEKLIDKLLKEINKEIEDEESNE
jgi:transcriptional regulator with XRE-family HTH domain